MPSSAPLLPWSTIETKITFWLDVSDGDTSKESTWNFGSNPVPRGLTVDQKQAVMSALEDLYALSPTFAQYVSDGVRNNVTMRFGVGDSTRLQTPAGGEYSVQLNFDRIADWHAFSTEGTIYKELLALTVAHELMHLYASPADGSPGDPNVKALDPEQNLANFDFQGHTVRIQNQIAREMGWTDRIQSSYLDSLDTFEMNDWNLFPGQNYTDGEQIDVARLGTNAVDEIDHRARTAESTVFEGAPPQLRDLLFGFGGDDRIHAGLGRDFLYGGLGTDRLWGGEGADVLYGEDGNDFLWGGEEGQPYDDGFADRLKGGAGVDKYYVGSGDTVVDPDSTEERIYYEGTKYFVGGVRKKGDPANTYTGKDGTIYKFESVAGELGNLTIIRTDGSTYYVTDFINHEAGINLVDQSGDPKAGGSENYKSPLVLDLTGDGISIDLLSSQTVNFDFEGDGFAELTAWISPEDGFLALDRNGNGLVDNGSELFGPNPTDVEELPANGAFSNLAVLDSNFDRVVDASDTDFANLRVWRDLDSDGQTAAGELVTLASLGIASINLDATGNPVVVPDGRITEQSTFTRTDGTTAEIADVWFRTDPTQAIPEQDVEIGDAIQTLPYLGGSGLTRDLHSAMQLDPLLAEMVSKLVSLDPSEFDQFASLVEAIFLRWTGADQAAEDGRGPWMDGQMLNAVERWTGDRFVQQLFTGESDNPYPQSAAAVTLQYREILGGIAAKLLALIPAGDVLLPELTYAMDAFLLLDEDFDPADFVSRMATGSPEDAADRWAYWKGVVEVGLGLATLSGLDPETFESTVDAALATIDSQMSYQALSRLFLGTDGDDRITGTSNELDFTGGGGSTDWTLPYLGGVDWIMGGAGDDVISTGYGRDTILFGIGSGHDSVQESSPYSSGSGGSADPSTTEVVQLLGDLTLADIETSLVEEDGRTIARITITGTSDVLDFEVANARGPTGLTSVTILDSAGTPLVFDVDGNESAVPGTLTLEDLSFQSSDGQVLRVYGPNGQLLTRVTNYYMASTDGFAFMLGTTPVSLSDIDAEILRRQQTSGSDWIAGSVRSDEIVASGGNDIVNANKGDDLIDGGAGSDRLNGGRGIDTYLFSRGSGVDIVSDPFGLNRVRFGPDIELSDLELSYGPTGADLAIRIAGTTDQLVILGEFPAGNSGVETFEFADNSTMSRADILALLPAPPVDLSSVLQVGTNGEDLIQANGGFAIGVGREGRDTYVFNRGDGILWIGDGDFDDGFSNPGEDPDIIRFGEGVSPDDIEIRLMPKVVDDYAAWYPDTTVEIRIRGTDDAIRIFNFSPFWSYDYDSTAGQFVLANRDSAVDTIEFADGQSWDLDRIFLELEKGTPGDDYIIAWNEGATIDGGAGNDTLNIDNTMRALEVVQVAFDRNSGHDNINAFGVDGGTQHKVVFGQDIALGDLIVRAVPPGKYQNQEFWGFEIGIAGSDAQLLIDEVGSGASFELADGTVLDIWDLAQMSVDQAIAVGEKQIDVFGLPLWYGAGAAVTLQLADGMGARSLNGGNVTIELPDGVDLADVRFVRMDTGFALDLGNGDTLTLPNLEWQWSPVWGQPPSEYNFPVTVRDGTGATISNAGIIDELQDGGANVGTSAAEIFDGRSANDWFVGMGGADVVRFGYGSGQDIFSGSVSVEFKAGVDFEDIGFERGSDSIIFRLAGSSDQLIVASYSLESLSFAGGQTYTAAEFFDDWLLAQQTTPGDDRIYVPAASAGSSVTPGAGNDVVRTGSSDLELRFSRGDGNDVFDGSKVFLDDVQSVDELEFRAIYSPDVLDYSGLPYPEEYRDWERSYEIIIRDTGDSIRLDSLSNLSWFTNDVSIRLASGDVVTASQFDQIMTDRAMTNQSDTFTTAPGYNRAITVDGRGGNDRIDGHLSENIYLFGYGDGQDVLIENNLWDDYFFDVLRFKDGVTPNDVTVSLNSDGELTFSLDGSTDQVVVPSYSNRMFRPGIEQVEFADGTVWAMDDILEDLSVATAGDDVIIEPTARYEIPDGYGTSAVFDGGAGDDFLAGGAGADFYVFGLGYGSDAIFEQSPRPLWAWVYGDEDYDGAYPDPEVDVLTFEPGIDADDLQFLRGGTTGDDLIIRIRGTDDQVTIVGQFAPLAVQDTMMLLYDYVWPQADPNGNGVIDPEELNYVTARYLAASPNGIEAIRFSSQVELSIDEIEARIEGTDNSGDNVYVADEIGGTLDGGAGDDVLHGSANDDDFVFESGDGNDRIDDQGGYDIVQFGEGVRQEYLHFSRTGENGDDLLIEVDGLEPLTLTVADQFAQLPPTVEEFTFLTGKSMSWLDVQDIILAQQRTGGADTIRGFLTDDVIDGGNGDDSLTGWKGNDLLLGGNGWDTAIFSGAQSDYTVENIDGGVRVTDLRANADGVDMLYGIEELKFAGDDESELLADPNQAPEAGALSRTTSEEQRLIVLRAAILAEASDPDGDTLGLAEVRNAVGGTAWINLAGNVVFDPAADFFGEGGFDYVVSDGNGGTALAHVTVAVSGTADAPRVAGILQDVEVDEDSPVDIEIPAGLFVDPDGDALILSATLADGSPLPAWLALSNGRLQGSPPDDFNGELGISIIAADAQDEASVEFMLVIRPVNDAPVVAGTMDDFAIVPDEAFEFEVPNGLFADVDGDPLELTATLADGSALPSWISFNGLTFSGIAPFDFTSGVEIKVLASDGDELVSTTFTVSPTAEPNIVVGTGSDDVLQGSAGVDRIYGLGGNDTLVGGLGADLLVGGTGSADVASYTGASSGVTLSLATGGTAGEANGDQYNGIENVAGSEFNDVISGDAGANALAGNGGNDTFRYSGGSNGFDNISGGSGQDTIEALANDTVIGLTQLSGVETVTGNGFSGVRISGSSGADTLSFASVTVSGIARIEGGAGADTIVGPATAMTFAGGAGDDDIQGGAGNDIFEFGGTGDGIDRILAGGGYDIVRATANNTVIGLYAPDVWPSVDISIEEITANGFTGVSLVCSDQADDLDMFYSNNNVGMRLVGISQVSMGAGDDIFYGPRNTVSNPAPVLTINGGAGDDWIQTTSGSDTFEYTGTGLGTDGIVGGSGGSGDTIRAMADNTIIGLYWINGIETVTANGFSNVSVLGTDFSDVLDFRSTTVTGITVIDGGGGSDEIKGSSAADNLAGGSGNDLIHGGGGNDTINGGADTDDWVQVAGTRATYTLQTVNGQFQIVDNAPTTDGDTGTDTLIGIEKIKFKDQVIGITSPIILDLDGDGVEAVTSQVSRARFDMDGDGIRDDTSWIGRDDGFLFLDRDGNGTVSSVAEMSFTGDLPGASTDLEGLASFDSNGDGLLSTLDARFGEFRIWRDANGDGVAGQGEILTLGQAGFVSLNLAGQQNNSTGQIGGVAIVNTGSWTRADGHSMQFADAMMTYTASEITMPEILPPDRFGRTFSNYSMGSGGPLEPEAMLAGAAALEGGSDKPLRQVLPGRESGSLVKRNVPVFPEKDIDFADGKRNVPTLPGRSDERMKTNVPTLPPIVLSDDLEGRAHWPELNAILGALRAERLFGDSDWNRGPCPATPGLGGVLHRLTHPEGDKLDGWRCTMPEQPSGDVASTSLAADPMHRRLAAMAQDLAAFGASAGTGLELREGPLDCRIDIFAHP